MEIKLLSGALGAEIKGIDLTDVSNENFTKINNFLIDACVGAFGHYCFGIFCASIRAPHLS